MRNIPGILNAPESLIGVARLVTSRDSRPAAVGDAGRGPEVSLLSLRGPSRFGRSVSIMVSALRDARLGGQGYSPGVITGILHFGNGGGLAKLEFDIPCAETHDLSDAATSGMAFSVPAGNIHLLARDDSKIIPKTGMGFPSDVSGAMVSAHATYGVMMAESILKKTAIWAWKGLAIGLPVGETSNRIPIPPFCQDFIFIRYPRSGLTVTMGTVIKGGSTILEIFTFLPDIDISTLPIPPRCTWLQIRNDGPSTIDHGQCVFNMPFYYLNDPNSGFPPGSSGGWPGPPDGSGDGGGGGGSFGFFFNPDGPGGGGPGGGDELLAACQKILGTFEDAPAGAIGQAGSELAANHSVGGMGAYLNSEYRAVLLDSTGNNAAPVYRWGGSGVGAVSEMGSGYSEIMGLPNPAYSANLPQSNDVAFVGIRLPTRLLRFRGATQTFTWGPDPPAGLTGGSNSFFDSQGKGPRVITMNKREIFACNGLSAGKFNGVDETWSLFASPPSEFTNSVPSNVMGMAVLNDGRIFVLVSNSSLSPADEVGICMVFNPYTNTWTMTPPTPYGHRYGACACLPNNRVLVCGGLQNDSTFGSGYTPAHNLAAVYDGNTNTWITDDIGTMTTARALFTMVSMPDGKVLVVGGKDREYQFSFFDGMDWEDRVAILAPTELSSTEIFDPVTGNFGGGPSMAHKRTNNTGGLFDYAPQLFAQVMPGDPWRVVIAGGQNSGQFGYTPVRQVEVLT